MKTLVLIEVEHDKQIPNLARMVAGRAWSIQGVNSAKLSEVNRGEIELHEGGFTDSEIALGRTEVVRG